MFRKELKKLDGRKLFLYSDSPISDEILATSPPIEKSKEDSHFRWHPLRGEWVAYASHRQNRTFLPPKEYSPLAVTKPGGTPTELPAGDYQVAVFENLFPSMSPGAGDPREEFFVPTRAGRGACEVVVFTQDPDTTLGAMSIEKIKLVLQAIADRTREIGSRSEIEYVLPFENKGVEVGVTLNHPHGQIYSYPFIPPHVEKILATQIEYFKKEKQGLLESMLTSEIEDGRRILVESRHAVAFVPVCARYAYETWIVPRRRAAFLHEYTEAELYDLAKVLKTVLLKFDGLWKRPFPYLMSFFQGPTKSSSEAIHTHIQFFPPYRSSDRLKFLAGTELAAGMFVNDSLPEEKAAELRAVEVNV